MTRQGMLKANNECLTTTQNAQNMKCTHTTNAISGNLTLLTRPNMIRNYHFLHRMILPELDISDQAMYILGLLRQCKD